ncbi:hypothetical protein A7A08_03061 [Methyloligella halotolerans]|uniref:Uncharacterized protein n=1 Tax=Methyloligella halotolerans TaxID=1177755 RepID=A0A1E2RUX1_9HYPH|nr:hypothetical protein [Methyloligella halotolerans]ODA66047.1 hypothetical protein A7A08_03061 [Methyloligella halotolerans]
MADTLDINNLQSQIDLARQDYASAVNHVLSVSPSDINRAVLIEVCDEFGVEFAVARMQESPGGFGLKRPVSESEAKEVTAALDELMQRTELLDELYARREDILCAADPTRQRRYCIDARECVIDPISDTLTFLDDPGRGYRLESVMTKDAQELESRSLEPGTGSYEREHPDDEPRF